MLESGLSGSVRGVLCNGHPYRDPGSNSDFDARNREVRFRPAGPTGRRNTGVKSLCWGFELQGLTWPFVELTSYFVQISLRVHRQVGALRKVLSHREPLTR